MVNVSWGRIAMSLVEGAVLQDDAFLYDPQSATPADCLAAEAADARDGGDPLGAARGILLAALLGGLFWTGILWAVL